jgi:hypothetical protein
MFMKKFTETPGLSETGEEGVKTENIMNFIDA